MSNEEELTEEEMEELQKLVGNQDAGYGYPEAPKKDSIFKFFREILNREDTTKVGFLKPDEIGKAFISVRQYQNIANYAHSEGLDKVSDYLNRKSHILTSSSMSHKGFLAQLFVTQIKKEQKVIPPKPKKEGWFKKDKQGDDME